jgi:exodeoxyribonuclease VII large subunit
VVQGDGAIAEIEEGIALANQDGIADVIVLARGGGSLEDLAAFNSERVARAIASSRLPVVSAIGHETDFTIADFVADLRAPTPSAAAELITEAQHRVEEVIASLSNRMVRAMRYQLLQMRQRLDRVPAAYAQQRVTTSLHRLEQRVDDLSFRLDAAMNESLRSYGRVVSGLVAAVLRHDPRRQLSTAREALAASQSRLSHALDRGLSSARHRSQSLEARLYRAAQVAVANRRSAYTSARGQLQSLSPLAVLQRGYALVLDESGAVIRSVGKLATLQTVSTRLSDGSFTSQITQVHSNKTVKSERKKKGKTTST